MKTKTGIAAFALTLSAVLACNSFAAQNKREPKDDKPARAERAERGDRNGGGLQIFTKALESVTDLSDDQKSATQAVIENATAELKALREEARSQGDQADRKALRVKAQEILLNVKTSVEAELNDTQKATFRESLKSLRQDAAEKRGDAGERKAKKEGKQDAGA